MRGISEKILDNNLGGVGFGYIILPEGISRDKYVTSVYRRERVSILPESGGTPVHDCLITHSAIDNIYIPKKSNELGSGVVFLTTKNSGYPIVIDTVSKMDENSGKDEHSFKIFKSKDGSYVICSFDANSNSILFDVRGTGSSTFKISASGEDSKVIINSSGSVNIDARNNVKIRAREGFKVETDDKLYLKNNSEDLGTVLRDFTEVLQQAIITTGVGPANFAPNTITELQQITVRLNNLLK